MDSKLILKESSYDWAILPDDLPKENLVLVTAKTKNPTKHLDTKWRNRKFTTKELHEAARSLAYRPVNDTHADTDIKDAFVVDAQWNESTQAVEALLYLPDNYINFIKNEAALGRDVKYSVEYSWRDEKYNEADDSTEFIGLVFRKIAILVPEHMPEGFSAGDVATTSTLAEDYFNKRGLMEMTEVTDKKDESKKDKVSIEEGLQIAIKALEKEKETLTNKLTESEKALNDYTSKYIEEKKQREEVQKKLSEVTEENKNNIEAVTKLQEKVKGFDTEKLSAIQKAKSEAKLEVIGKLREIVPSETVSNFKMSGRVLSNDINRVLKEMSR